MWKFASQLGTNAAELENWELGAAIYFDFYNLKSSLEGEEDVMDELVWNSPICSRNVSR